VLILKKNGGKLMIRKSTAIILTATMCLPLFACSSGSKYKTSGKPYVNYDQGPEVSDAFHYWTEENQTDNFIAYRASDGEVKLYIMREGKHSPYSTDGLCKVVPGKAYTITYDVQYETGGLAGIYNVYFLTVYDYEECSYDKLFENGCSWNSDWESKYPINDGLKNEAPYVVLKGFLGGYDIFSAKNGKNHYTSEREVRYPVEINGEKYELSFNVYCNWTLPDSYIIDQLMNRKYEEDPKFVFCDCCRYEKEDGSTKFTYDSLERLATGSTFARNSYRFISDEIPDESKRLITYEEIQTKTAEELGLEKWLYSAIYYGCLDKAKGRVSIYNADKGPAKKCDVLIFTGNFERGAGINYDKDLRFYVNGSHPKDEDAGEDSFCYYVLFINSEFNDLLPQD